MVFRMKLRDYQTNSIDMLREGFKQGHKHQVLQLSTGSGKTIIAAQIVKNVVDKGGVAWFVCDNLELIEQTISVFEGVGLEIGVIQGIHEKTNHSANVQIITAQTLTRRWPMIDKLRDIHPDLILIDECHCQYKAHREMIGMFKNIPVIGLSATPWAKGMSNMYSNLVVGVTTGELIKQGYLCDYDAYAPFMPDMTGIKVQNGDYKPAELDEKINNKQITADVVDTWVELGQNRQTLCYAVNIAHSKAITDAFVSRGINAAHLDGYSDKDERAEIIAAFKAGKINILSSVGVLTKGFDAPSATCLIIARPTKSLMLHIQILGRGLRVSPCGKDLLILDHSGNISRLGACDDAMPDTLDDGRKKNPLEKKIEEKEKELKSPKPCHQCNFLHTEFKCPSCGYMPVIQHGVETVKGELKKLERVKKSPAEKRNSTTSKEDKQAFYSAALGYAKHKKWKEGWAANQYRSRFGCWPNAMVKVTGPSTDAFNAQLKAKNIKYAKRRNA